MNRLLLPITLLDDVMEHLLVFTYIQITEGQQVKV